MLANRVREYSTTVGTGDITLSGAIAGHVAFASAFTVGDSVIYVVEDDDNYEIGTGTLVATGTLERTEVTETLVAGVLTREGAVAITLTGSARVYCAATADFLLRREIAADVVREVTAGAGVTVDGVLIKDTTISSPAASALGLGAGGATDQLVLNTDGSSAFSGAIQSLGRHIIAGDNSDNSTVFEGKADLSSAGVPLVAVKASWNNTAVAQINMLAGTDTANKDDGSIQFLTAAAGSLMPALTLGSDTSATFAGDAFVAGSWLSTNNTNVTGIGSGSSGSNGGNIRLFPGSHATQAGDIEFRAGSTPWLSYDNSAGIASFVNNLRIGTGPVMSDAGIGKYLFISGSSAGIVLDASDADQFEIYSTGTLLKIWSEAASADIFTLNAEGKATFVGGANSSSSPLITLGSTGNDDINYIKMGTNNWQGVASHGAAFLAYNAWHNSGVNGYYGGNNDEGYASIVELCPANTTTANVFRIVTSSSAIVTGSAITLTELFSIRQNGEAVFAEGLLVSGDLVKRNSNTGSITISGGITAAQGGAIIMYGYAHATNANDVAFMSAGSTKLLYDASATSWNFQGLTLTKMAAILRGVTTGFLAISGGTTVATGGNVIMYGESHETNAGDIAFRSATDTKLQWDNSAAVWDFKNSAIQALGNVGIGGAPDAGTAKLKIASSTATMIQFDRTIDASVDSLFQLFVSHDGSASTDYIGMGSNASSLRVYGDGTVKTMNDLKVAGRINYGSPTELTIVSGAIALTKSFHSVDTEADAASDDVDTISGANEGDSVTLVLENAARPVVIKHDTGNIKLAGGVDFTFGSLYDTITLVYRATKWCEISRSNIS
ncbi:hypothetical protein [Kordiimonas pumila]|uniref:Uncharacterized protein n=1 Tax=Kordiimonas pumila TaxID=2161677 RepID=A0ABV7D3A5_9PROT|nr:hypothetical protein [Kordiimonas pumila]